jgi:hypothetical protein
MLQTIQVTKSWGNAVLAVLSLVSLAAPTWAQPTVMNGDFETDSNLFSTWPGYLGFFSPPPITGFPPGTNPSEIPSWNSHTGAVGVAPASEPGNPDLGFRDNGDHHANAAFIQGGGSISQIIHHFRVGTTYQLDFDYDARDCCGDFPSLTVSIGDLGVGYMDPLVKPVDPRGVHLTPWYHGRFTFTADSNPMTLTFSSLAVNRGDGSLLIGNIVLSVVSP